MSLRLGNKIISGIGTHTKYNAHSLLDFKWADHILNEMSWLRADTFSWQSGDVYTSVYNLLVAEYQNGTEETEGSITFKRSANGYKITTDESGVIALFNNTGVAWYYILDTENRRFKLPRTKYGFIGLGDGGPGGFTKESLPNIKGSYYGTISYNTFSGAFSQQGGQSGSYSVANRDNQSGYYWDFNASRSSSVYQDNAPVQQRATQMYLYFYVGEFSQTAIEQTAGLNTELFNTKADISASNLNTQGKSLISGLGMPSNRYIDLTIGSQGTTYVAPANGFWGISGHTSNATAHYYGYIQILTENDVIIGTIPYGTYAYFTGGGLIPAKKGQKMKIAWKENNTIIDFLRFIYAEGEN